MAVSRSTARKRAKKEWNSEADEYNQWDALCIDEKTQLIDAMVKRMGGTPPRRDLNGQHHIQTSVAIAKARGES